MRSSGDVSRPGFRIHYETLGPERGTPLLLVSGLGEQIGSVEFPDELCRLLVERACRVIRIDNRDTGLSTPTSEPESAPAPYTLVDMADDVVAVLDALGIERAHLCGASLGGFIVRWAALRQPARVASIAVVMSGSGAAPGEEGPQAFAEALPRLFALAERRPRAAAIEFLVGEWRWLWGDALPFEEDWVRARVSAAYERAYRPEGIARALMAAVASPGLWRAQEAIHAPTLVLHGGRDPIFGPEHGRAIAERVPGAKLWLEPQMGHTMHREHWPALADALVELGRR